VSVSMKALALAASLAAALSTALVAQTQAQAPKSDPQIFEVPDLATLDWIEKSNVAALREGVIESMELQIGMPVKAKGTIGKLHSEIADLSVKKAEIAANSKGPLGKAAAQKEVALAVVARNVRLDTRIRGAVSEEDKQKAEAELKVAEAAILDETEKISLAKADLGLARRTLEEHTIISPFDGIVLERMKHPGESVRANEAVVKIGNLSKIRAYAYVPLEYGYSVKEGQVVEIQLILAGSRSNPLPIERKRFRGKITVVDKQVQAIAETAVRIFAEFDNKDLELRPGLKARMTIFLNTEADAVAAGNGPAVGVAQPTGVER
jgi:RND family efflux transporter MFP subunit